MPLVIVHATVVPFIGSLNATVTTWSKGTSIAPSGGSVVTTYGLMQTVVNDHGFGAEPATRSSPSFTSFPPVICTVYWTQSRNCVVGISLRVLLEFDQEAMASTPPLIVHVTVGVLIRSLKFTQIGASTGMFDRAFAGLVLVMPLSPVPTVVSCATSPVATVTRYRLGMPLRSEMKYSDAASGDHCGLMFLPAVNARSCSMRPLSGSMMASRYGPMLNVERFDENRSVANAMRLPSGDHAGCRSANASFVSRRRVEAFKS